MKFYSICIVFDTSVTRHKRKSKDLNEEEFINTEANENSDELYVLESKHGHTTWRIKRK
jgi:hypothetical protein